MDNSDSEPLGDRQTMKHDAVGRPKFGEIPLSLHPSIVNWRVAWPGLWNLATATGYCSAVIARDQPPWIEVPDGARASTMQLPVEVRKDESIYEETFSRLHPICRLAAQLDCRTAVLGIFPSSELPKNEQAALLRRRLIECVRILDQFSIRLALECVTPLHLRRENTYGFIWQFDEMLDFALSVSPKAGLVIDSWHWHHAGADPDAFMNIPNDHILDVHIADAPDVPAEAIRDSERLLPGEGIINFNRFFGLLRDKNYSRDVAIEVFGRGLPQMRPEDAVRLAFEKARSIIQDIHMK